MNKQSTVKKKVASNLHNKLMSAGYKSESVAVVESLRYILTKRVASTTWRDAPSTAIIWV